MYPERSPPSFLVDSRRVRIACRPNEAFRPIQHIGGSTGWYYANWLWRLRAYLDRLFGGPGMRRSSSHPERLQTGDVLDFWTVDTFQPGRLLLLRAEMKLPGQAWLQFRVEEEERGSLIIQDAIFKPAGLTGLLYWYLLYPVHTLVFAGLLRGLARAATLPVEGRGGDT